MLVLYFVASKRSRAQRNGTCGRSDFQRRVTRVTKKNKNLGKSRNGKDGVLGSLRFHHQSKEQAILHQNRCPNFFLGPPELGDRSIWKKLVLKTGNHWFFYSKSLLGPVRIYYRGNFFFSEHLHWECWLFFGYTESWILERRYAIPVSLMNVFDRYESNVIKWRPECTDFTTDHQLYQ